MFTSTFTFTLLKADSHSFNPRNRHNLVVTNLHLHKLSSLFIGNIVYPATISPEYADA